MSFIEKHRNIVDYTLSSLLRRKLKNISLFLVYTSVVFLIASVMFFTRAIKQEATLVLRNAPEIVVQRQLAGRQDLVPLDYIEKLKEIRGVQSVKPRLWGYYYDPTARANYTILATDDMQGSSGMLAVGGGVAKTLTPNTKDEVFLKSHNGSYARFRIKGVLTSLVELESADLVLMSESDFRMLFNYPEDRATDLVLSVRNPKEFATIAAKITQILPDTRPILRDELLRTYDAVLNWRAGIFLVVLSGAILAFVILAWDKATGLSAEEKREIGILKAVGWETSDILVMKGWEGTAISLSAFLVGVLLAYAHVFLGSSLLFEPVLKGWSVLYPKFSLTPLVSTYDVATIFMFTVVPYTVATIGPAWRVATIDPDSVVRA